jgi:integrase/recombinase XerD
LFSATKKNKKSLGGQKNGRKNIKIFRDTQENVLHFRRNRNNKSLCIIRIIKVVLAFRLEVKTMLDDYLKYLQSVLQLSQNTIKAVANDIAKFATEDGEINNATRADAEAFVSAMHSQGLSTSTISRRVSSLKNFFAWQIDNDFYRSKNPFGGRLTPKVRNNSHKAVAQDVLQKISDDTEADYLLCVLGLGAYAGLRISEILQLDETTYFGDWVEIVGKGNKKRAVSLSMLPDKTKKAVATVATKGGFKGQRGRLTLSGLQKLVSKWLTKYDITSHCLRASFATNSLGQGLELNIVRSMLGHASLDTTSIYVRNATVDMQQKALQKVL